MNRKGVKQKMDRRMRRRIVTRKEREEDEEWRDGGNGMDRKGVK